MPAAAKIPGTPALARALLPWYRQHGRPLPWRSTRHPYRILISETMLQQTQVSRVLLKYPLFLSLFPDFAALAAATPGEVIRAWQGMGYNNRALRLRKLAGIVVRERDGKLPSEISALLTLPGVGPYTAHAVACFSFGRRVPVIDTNIRRVLGRVYPSSVKARDQWILAENILPPQNAYEWNQALMELGALVCTAGSPHCTECPWQTLCPSAHKVHSQSGKKAKREPNRKGVPNRIYRGRIVEFLRNAKGPVEVRTLMREFGLQKNSRDGAWLDSLLEGLQRDELLCRTKKRNKIFLSLPK
jgi:A/G-specific adenine glycosylase